MDPDPHTINPDPHHWIKCTGRDNWVDLHSFRDVNVPEYNGGGEQGHEGLAGQQGPGPPRIQGERFMRKRERTGWKN